jgi:hypothetical protein
MIREKLAALTQLNRANCSSRRQEAAYSIAAANRNRLEPPYVGCYYLINFTILLLGLVLAGCSKSGPGKDISSSAFDSAPADVKQSWNDGIAAWKGHHYAQAATNFVSLQSKTGSLSQQQADALTKAVDEFGQEAFEAANKGNAEATEAVKALRGTGRRSAIGK